MSENSGSTGRRQLGRGEKVRTAVIAATLLELAEHGYAGLSVDAVARRAGVNKTTVYRRWTDRRALVLDAITEQIAAANPIPDTGAVESDLHALVSGLIRTLASPGGQAMTGTMLVGAADVPEIAQVRRQFFDDRIRRAEPIVIRAIQRGELPAGTDPVELIKTLVAPVYLRLLVTSEPLDETTADRAVAVVLAAARAGTLTSSKRSG
jgi:AcrR family transcriptional regulator